MKFICMKCHKSFEGLSTKNNFSLCEKCLNLGIIKFEEEKDDTCPQCLGTGKINLIGSVK